MNKNLNCTQCGKEAIIAMSKWKEASTGREYYKKGERLCM